MSRAAPQQLRIRRTRRTTTLLVDGSCATVWHAGRATTGGIWDLLAAPVLLAPDAETPRVLVLGVGGGAVLRVLRALCPAARLTGVELDPAVLALARREFALDALGADLLCGDARAIVRALPRRRLFDVIIDDVYVRAADGMRKPPGWAATLRAAAARRRAGGLLVCNALAAADARAIAAAVPLPWLALEHEAYHNRILLSARDAAPTAYAVSRRLRTAPPIADTRRRTRVRRVP